MHGSPAVEELGHAAGHVVVVHRVAQRIRFGRSREVVVELDIDDHHLGRAGAMEGFAERLANAVGAPGDNDNLSGYLHRYPPLTGFQVMTRSRMAV